MPAPPEQDDADLFRQLLGEVTPLKPSQRKSPAHPRRTTGHLPPASSRVTLVPDTWSDHGADDPAPTEYLIQGLNRMILRDLRRGKWRVQDQLDLHGLNGNEARQLLAEFLHQARQRGLRCICVIHGKGWRSEGREGLLKVLTRHWLRQHGEVLAFCDAPPQAGGGGAVWVLLKRQDGGKR
ncbi:MAG: hypothetical protein Fur0040_12630 [Sideroxydans sp.]